MIFRLASGVLRRAVLHVSARAIVTGLLGGIAFPAFAIPVCSIGSDGTVTIDTPDTRVNVYYAAPDPVLGDTVVQGGSSLLPFDDGLGPQAGNLHPAINPTINPGDVLVVAQMIGAEIDASDNHLAAGNYGDGPGGLNQAGSLASGAFSAGHYEFVLVTGPVVGGNIPIEGAGGGGLINTYINSNSITPGRGIRRYQIVKVPQFVRLTINGQIVPDRWNGRWGGIAAVNVRELTDLAGGSFNADGRGFRGGQYFPERSDTDESAVNGNFGFKGEGIAGIPQRLFSRALLLEQPASNGEEGGPIGYPGADGGGPLGTAWTRDTGLGAPGNAGSGGGGGKDAGGGGGGNAGRGGSGGEGTGGGPGSPGIGGAAFPEHFPATSNRLAMGGGGGASNGNDNGDLDLTVSSGQAGGGIAFIRSFRISASGGRISVNGDSAGSALSQGGGGGGAGGTILIHTGGAAVDNVAIAAAGGAGGSSSMTEDGGGGGGSGGIVWLSDTATGSATFDVDGGAGGTGASDGAYNGTDGDMGSVAASGPLPEFACAFVTVGIAKEVTSLVRVGSTGEVYDVEFTLVVENLSATDAVNIQVEDDLGAAFPGAASITLLGAPSLDGLTAPSIAFDAVSQTDLLEGTDSIAAFARHTLNYTVRIDLGSATGPFMSQAFVKSSQTPGAFANTLDASDDGSDPDPDGDGDPTETIATGGDSDENDPTAVIFDLDVAPAICAFDPNPALSTELVTATCTGVETDGTVGIPGMSCGAETGGTVVCTGLAGDVGSNPIITTNDAAGNTTDSVGDLTVIYPIDTDEDGIPDVIEGGGDTDGDGIPDAEDPDSDNDGIPDDDEDTTVPPSTGSDGDGDGIDDSIDVDETGGTDGNNNGVDDALEPEDSDGDGIPDYQDIDADNDGIPDAIEGTPDTDGDRIPDYLDLDSDGDGILDSAEGPSANDVDADGIDDAYDADVTGQPDADGNGIVDDILSVDADFDGIPDADTDNDGRPDFRDLDADNDSINDIVEAGLPDTDGNGLIDPGTTPVGNGALPDTDNDGTPDFQDLDSNDDGVPDIAGSPDADLDGDQDGRVDDPADLDVDGIADLADGAPRTYGDAGDDDNDGISNQDEDVLTEVDTDDDGTPDYLDTDSDNDGIPDLIEGQPDSDGDGVPDYRDTDSDNDGILDRDEADNVPPLTGGDMDGDGIDDAVDTDLTGGPDANGNGIDDNFEPVDSDTDGLPDYLDLDADGDGILDIIETTIDTDGDGTGDWRDLDTDSDTLDDAAESDNVPTLSGQDSDSDGIDDAVDVDQTGGADLNGDGIADTLYPVDTDDDGTPDWRDVDSDNDGYPDSAETGDTDGNGIPDRLEAATGQLETAVRGSGSFGIIGLAMLLLALGWRARGRHRAIAALALCLIAPAWLPSGSALAQDCRAAGDDFEPCWYAGVGIGLTKVDPEGQGAGWSTRDDSDNGAKLFGGYRLRPRWSIEFAYVDGGEAGLGNVNPAVEALFPDASIDYATPSVMGVYWLRPADARFAPFLKFGLAAIDNEASSPSIPFSKEHDTELATGIGAQWRLGRRMFLRAEGDFYDRDHNYAGLSLGWTFGLSDEPAPVVVVPPVEPPPPEPSPPARPAPAPAPPPTQPPPAPAQPPQARLLCNAVRAIQFEFDSFDLTDQSIAVLTEALPRIQANLPDTPIRIEAHTDSDGTEAYNQRLSENRGRVVLEFLRAGGITDEMSSVGYGETRPLADNATAEGRAQNRRVAVFWDTDACDE